MYLNGWVREAPPIGHKDAWMVDLLFANERHPCLPC